MERKDYCGPYWMPRWFRRMLSNKFNASCKIHDMDYNSKKYSRDEADARFQDHMNKQSKHSLKWRFTAFVYYVLVRLGGKLSWDKAKEEEK